MESSQVAHCLLLTSTAKQHRAGSVQQDILGKESQRFPQTLVVLGHTKGVIATNVFIISCAAYPEKKYFNKPKLTWLGEGLLFKNDSRLPYEGRIFLLPEGPTAAPDLPYLVTTALEMSEIQEQSKTTRWV